MTNNLIERIKEESKEAPEAATHLILYKYSFLETDYLRKEGDNWYSLQANVLVKLSDELIDLIKDKIYKVVR